MRRPGTYFVAETKHSDKKSRLFNFSFSTIQGYQLEFGDKYIRFYKDFGQIVVAYTAWITTTVYSEGDLVTNSGSYYRCLVDHTAGTFATDLAALKWEATDGATDLAYEIPSPYLEADLALLKVVQSADVFFIVHPSYAPRELSRTGHTSWTLDAIPFVYGDERTIADITQANPAVVTCANHGFAAGQWVRIGGVNGMTQINNQWSFVWAVTTNTFTLYTINSSGYSAYTSGGIIYPYHFGGTPIAIEGITAANPVVVTATAHGIPDGTKILFRNVGGMTELNHHVFITSGATADSFHLHGYSGANLDGSGYSAYTSGGIIYPTVFSVAGDYPGSIALFEQRMQLSGSDNEPQTIYGSAAGDFTMFDLNVVSDASAYKYSLATEKVDRVHWMMGQDYLMLGTPGGISRLGGTSTTDALTQTNVNVKKQATFGTKNCDAELVGDAILYVTRGGLSVREIYYTWNTADANGGYRTTDLTILAGHIAKGATAALS
ncbi:MAG: ubiquitin-activating E1 FCCH domain-containing protein, partial [Smithella sp.]